MHGALVAALFSASLWLAVPFLQAESTVEGYAAYRSGKYPAALSAFSSAAARGDGRAMNYLGEMYATGKGVAQDYARAVEWFRSGAEAGDPEAANNLGEMCANGWGVKMDHGQAVDWFRRASESGSALGQYNLGRMLVVGIGVAKAPAQAAAHLEKAVKAFPGDARFRNWLGSVYCDLNRFDAADEQFHAIVSNGGKPSEAWNFYWGVALLRLGRLDEAYDALARCRDEGKSHNRGVNRQAEAAAQMARIERYREHYRQATDALAKGELDKARAELQYTLGSIETAEAREGLAVATAKIKDAGLRRLLIAAVALFALFLAAFGAVVARLRRRSRPVSEAELTSTRLEGRYQLQEAVGEGGMGQVYAAFDHERGCKVAAKRLRPELKAFPEARRRFLDEAKAVSGLKHPNIVGIQAVVDFKGETILIMDYLEGEPLSTVLSKRKRLGLEEARDIMSQICAAVEYAHRHGVVHRDLKPSNIMLDAQGKAMVMDFGLARELEDTLSRLASTAVVGTQPYMAPEQHLGKVCRQSDVYALGVTLYELVTGVRPFAGPDFLAQKERLLYKRAGELVAGLPVGLDDIVASSLDPDPKKRPVSAADFSAWFLRILENHP